MKRIEYKRFGNYEHFIYEEDVEKPRWIMWLGVIASIATILALFL